MSGLNHLMLAVGDPAAAATRRRDYTHVAANEFDALNAKVRAAAVWKENRSEGPSLYFLDADGHKLELHVGTLASRPAGGGTP